jgi:hypothetical protein
MSLYRNQLLKKIITNLILTRNRQIFHKWSIASYNATKDQLGKGDYIFFKY